jgi:hypothetical protein
LDYYGLYQKYKVNRLLYKEERKLHLKQHDGLNVDPVYFYSTIRLNSSFVEVVDKFYAAKGFATTGMLVLIPLMATTLWLVGSVFFVGGLFSTSYDRNVGIFGGGFATLLGIAVLSFMIWGLLKEAFCYTHYPIRFNRKTSTVHVFRFDGTVLSVPWDTLFFTMGRCNRFLGIQTWDVRAHVLDSDGTTVRETFSLAIASPSQGDVLVYWEYIRRYMEEGPAAVISRTPVYLPISERRETWRFGLMRLVLDGPWAVLIAIMLPLYLPMSLGRWFAMRTSKIPVWPKEIDEVCCIELNDAYARDARDNPPKLWKALWANRKIPYLDAQVVLDSRK